MEKVEIENSPESLFAKKTSDKTNATANDLKFDKKKDLSLFETPTSLQKIALPDAAQVDNTNNK